jgi:hypothetical protein
MRRGQGGPGGQEHLAGYHGRWEAVPEEDGLSEEFCWGISDGDPIQSCSAARQLDQAIRIDLCRSNAANRWNHTWPPVPSLSWYRWRKRALAFPVVDFLACRT